MAYDPLMEGMRSSTAGASAKRLDPDAATKDPSEVQGQLQDSQWALFKERYRPIEDAAIQEFLKGTGEAAKDAGVNARRSLAGTAGVTDRSLGRRGVTMTGDQRKAAEAGMGLNAARTIATAENTARTKRRDRNMEGLGTMMSIGKGISGSAGDNLSAAAGLQHDREQQNAAAKQAKKQQNIQTASTVASLGLMAAMAF